MTTYHRLLTGVSGIALLPMVFIITTREGIATSMGVIASAALAGMVILLAVALLNQKGFRYALLLQVGYYLLFFVVVLLATYVH